MSTKKTMIAGTAFVLCMLLSLTIWAIMPETGVTREAKDIPVDCQLDKILEGLPATSQFSFYLRPVPKQTLLAICSVKTNEARNWTLRQTLLEPSSYEVLHSLEVPYELAEFTVAADSKYLAKGRSEVFCASGWHLGCFYSIDIYVDSGFALIRCTCD